MYLYVPKLWQYVPIYDIGIYHLGTLCLSKSTLYDDDVFDDVLMSDVGMTYERCRYDNVWFKQIPSLRKGTRYLCQCLLQFCKRFKHLFVVAVV